jgi:hypothetical protein
MTSYCKFHSTIEYGRTDCSMYEAYVSLAFVCITDSIAQRLKMLHILEQGSL